MPLREPGSEGPQASAHATSAATAELLRFQHWRFIPGWRGDRAPGMTPARGAIGYDASPRSVEEIASHPPWSVTRTGIASGPSRCTRSNAPSPRRKGIRWEAARRASRSEPVVPSIAAGASNRAPSVVTSGRRRTPRAACRNHKRGKLSERTKSDPRAPPARADDSRHRLAVSSAVGPADTAPTGPVQRLG
jgi:hypothetical protein